MKLRIPHTLYRALMACFAAFVSSSLASASLASSSAVSVDFAAPDVEQTDSMLCWAASAADILASESGNDAADIYRCITAASGNTPGYVESALSWYKKGATGELRPQNFDGSHTVSRSGFESVEALAQTLVEALDNTPAVSAMLYARGDEQSMGHAVTVYQSEYVDGRLFLTYADSADGVQGLLRAEVLETEQGLVLEGTGAALSALTFLGEEAEDVAPAAPVGGIMHSSPYLQEYTDMAENRGVYRFAYSPSIITYRNGEADYVLNVTPDYSSVADAGCYTLLHNGSAQVTVEHNGIMNGNTYTARSIGEYAQKYSVAGIRYNATFTFGTNNPYVPTKDDYRIERMTRLVTDTLASAYCTDESLLKNMAGVTVYRVGAGNSGYYDTSGTYHWMADAWTSGMTAGITSLMEQIFYVPETGLIGIQYHPSDFEQTSAADPLPSVGLQGDSGSPVFIYNEESGRMELVALLANADTTVWQAYYNPRATTAVDEYCTATIASATDYNAGNADATTLFLSGAVVGENDQLLEDGGAATHLRKGTISLNGETIATYNGVALEEFSQGTWKKLDADSLTWYTYSDNDYLNVAYNTATDAGTFGTDDLVYTSNLQFVANVDGDATTAHRRIELMGNVDLGIGHVQFSLGEGTTAATYDIGQSSSDYHLSSAGFVVDKGVTVNNYFTYEKGRELRRVGEGVMNMVGTGNSDVLLNIGGGGVTYLNRTNGYAAYSALVNSGAVLKLADAGQVYNNVTLGANGGVLDFNGNDYRWTSGGARSDGSFGLTVYEGLNRVETSVLANYASGTSSTITITRTDDFEFAGAFRDGSTYTGGSSVEMDSRYTMMPSVLMGMYKQYNAADRVDSDSTLTVIYNGGGKMEMTGVYTILTGDSRFEVASGTVSLHGTNTIHAIGSESGTNTNRLQLADDWHYAMAEMNVKVDKGATFELGDHALLIGDVQVAEGGNFVMKQAVNERLEYVEGWVLAEDTYALADYYGLKGNVNLASGANMAVRFDEGVATQLTYGGSISGAGSVTVAAGEGSVFLTGKNSFSGEKTVESGYLHLASGAEGDTSSHKWKVEAAGILALEGVSTNAELEARVDAASAGVLALTQDFAEQVSLSGLIVGAAAGESVHYGTSSQSLSATGNQWTLGGGGGTLYVDFMLEGANKLVLGNENGSGTVVLTNGNNSFSGGMEMYGEMTLGYTSAGALGNNVLTVGYGQTIAAMNGAAFAADKVATSSEGVFALSDGAENLDLRGHSHLSLGASGATTLTGTLTVADGQTYRLGGAGELTIATELSGAHGILIDGQGTTGSRVIFATASADTGAVVVQGYDATRASAGNVVLSFNTDNALAAASSVALQNNAGMDLGGTSQQFNNLSGDANSLIVDAVGGNTLTLNNTKNNTLLSSVQAAGTAVVKNGSGTLVLGGENLWKSLTINAGTVQVVQAESLGYLSSGSQGIAVTVNEGATLHLTQGMTSSNTFNIAGFGADGASYALKADGLLNNGLGSLNVTADAAISGQFSFRQLNLLGNTLSVKGSGSSFSATGMADGTLSLSEGATLNLGSNKIGASVALELNNATVNVAGGSIGGAVSVGEGGATINYPWNNSSTAAFNLTGRLTGDSAESTLHLVGHKHTINLSGGVDFAGRVEVGNGLTLNITKDATIGALINETNEGDTSTVVVNAATLKLTGSGNNFGSNGNLGTISLTNGGQLQLNGLADGSSMGSLGSLNMGTNGVLTLSSLAGYTGSNALMHIGELSGSGKLAFDFAELGTLGAGTYNLLTSGSKLTDFLSLSSGFADGRREFSLTNSALADGSYSLALIVGEGSAAKADWKGTGTLIAGTANATNITTDLATDDHTFMAMDSLRITTDAGSDTLTLGSAIYASSITYTGEGTMTLAQQNGGAFAAGTTVVVDAAGTLNLGSTTAVQGKMELTRGTVSASGSALNAMEGIEVGSGADATLVLTSDDAVTTALNVDGKLTVDSQQSQSGRQLRSNLSGAGTLVKTNSGQLNLLGDHSAFTGSIEVQAGTLQLGSYANGVLDTVSLNASSISMANGTTLVLKSTTAEYGADITWGDGAILRVAEGTGDGPSPTSVGYTLSGKQTLAGTLTYQSQWGKVTHISGDMEGSGALNFTSTNNSGGSPALVLSGNNTYSGGTTVDFNKGTLYAAGKNALGTGAITLKNGTLAWHAVGGDWDGDLTASSIAVSGGALDTNGYDVTYNGIIRGNSGTLTKKGEGTLKLTGFTYTGNTHIAEGTLELDPYYATLSTPVSGDAGATFRVNTDYTGNVYLMGTISGDVHLELQGHYGMSVANTHTGGTELLSGSLQIGNVNALQSGSLYAHEGTTVSVVLAKTYLVGDSVVDALAFESGASLLVGTDAAAGHLSFGSLSGPASFLLDVFSADSYDSLSGELSADSQLSVNLKASELGSYLLVAGNNTGYDASGITLSGKDESQYTYAWLNTQEGLTLNILNFATGSTNVWTGGTSGSWDNSSSSWNGNGSTYNAQVNTLFQAAVDTSISVKENVSTSILTAEVTEGATLDFSQDGGAITATTLQKDGEGTLSFASGSGNSFDSVVVNDGVLSVSAAGGNPLGTTAISGEGTLELTGGSVTARLHDTMTVKNIRITNGAELTFTSDTSNWGGSTSNRSIEIIGEGSSLSMTQWSNLNASSVILRDGGTVRSGDNGFGNNGGTIYVDGSGIIQYGNTGGGNLAASITGTGTLKVQDWKAGHWVAINGVISDDASAAAPLAVELSQNHVVMAGANSYSGGTTISGGTVAVSNASSLGSGSLHMTGGTLTMETTFRGTSYSTDLAIGTLSGTGGSIALGARELTVNQSEDATFAGTLSGSGQLTKTGEGTLTLSGSNSLGSLHLEQGKLEAAADGALGGASITMEEGTALHVTNGAEVSMTNASANAPAGAIVIESGTLNYNAGSSTTLGSVSGSGAFSLVGGTVTLGSVEQFTVSQVAVSGATLNLTGVSDFGDRQLTVRESGTVTANGAETLASSSLTINGGAVVANGTDLFFYVGSLSGTGGMVNASGKMLVVNQAVNGRYEGAFSGTDIIKRGDATLELGGSAEGLGLQIDSGTVKLVDSDVYAGSNGMTTSVLTMNGGVFDINGQTTSSGADSFMFDVYSGYINFIGSGDMLVTDSSGPEGSGLGFNTYYSYTAVSHGGTGRAEIAADIVSGGNGKAGDKIAFNIKSTGDMVLSGDIGADQSVAEHHQFGIAKNGSGSMILSGDNGYTGGTDVNAGTLVAASNTALGSGDVTVASGATLKVAEEVQLELKGTLKLGEVVTMTQQDTASAATLSSVEMSSSGTTAYIHGKVEGGLASLDNAVIDIAKGTSLEMKDVLLTQNTRITDDPSTLSVDNVTIALGEANAIMESTTTLVAGTTLVTAGGNETLVLTDATSVVSIFCSALDSVTVTGSSLTLDLSGLAADLAAKGQGSQYVAISFGQTKDSLAHFDTTSGLTISATLDGTTFNPAYVASGTQASASTIYIATSADAVPEPTTATLSLLALSMLAARRRRK